MRSDARKKLASDQAQQPYDTSGDTACTELTCPAHGELNRLRAALVEAQREHEQLTASWHRVAARAEQAERQVREIREGIAQAILNCRDLHWKDRETAANLARSAALSGVSGPTERPAKKRWISDREYEIGNDGPTTEGASDE